MISNIPIENQINIRFSMNNYIDSTLKTDKKTKKIIGQPEQIVETLIGNYKLIFNVKLIKNNISYHLNLDNGGITAIILRNSNLFHENFESFEKIILSHKFFDHNNELLKIFDNGLYC